MANTYTSLNYHVVSSAPKIENHGFNRTSSSVFGPTSAVFCRENEIKALLIGGIEDHVHLLLGIPAVLAVSEAVHLLKLWWAHPAASQAADLPINSGRRPAGTSDIDLQERWSSEASHIGHRFQVARTWFNHGSQFVRNQLISIIAERALLGPFVEVPKEKSPEVTGANSGR
jgi:hypothetical protein